MTQALSRYLPFGYLPTYQGVRDTVNCVGEFSGRWRVTYCLRQPAVRSEIPDGLKAAAVIGSILSEAPEVDPDLAAQEELAKQKDGRIYDLLKQDLKQGLAERLARVISNRLIEKKLLARLPGSQPEPKKNHAWAAQLNMDAFLESEGPYQPPTHQTVAQSGSKENGEAGRDNDVAMTPEKAAAVVEQKKIDLESNLRLNFLNTEPLEEFCEEVYMRAVSRNPTEDEAQRGAEQFVTDITASVVSQLFSAGAEEPSPETKNARAEIAQNIATAISQCFVESLANHARLTWDPVKLPGPGSVFGEKPFESLSPSNLIKIARSYRTRCDLSVLNETLLPKIIRWKNALEDAKVDTIVEAVKGTLNLSGDEFDKLLLLPTQRLKELTYALKRKPEFSVKRVLEGMLILPDADLISIEKVLNYSRNVNFERVEEVRQAFPKEKLFDVVRALNSYPTFDLSLAVVLKRVSPSMSLLDVAAKSHLSKLVS